MVVPPSHWSVGRGGLLCRNHGDRAKAAGGTRASAAIGFNRVEATTLATMATYCGLDLIAVIARSPIVLSDLRSAEPGVRLPEPDRFNDIDLAILDWIIAEGRRVGGNVPPVDASGLLELRFATREHFVKSIG